MFFIPLGSELPSRAMQAQLSGVCKADGNCFVAHFSEGEEPSTQEDYQIHPVDIRIYSGQIGFQKCGLLSHNIDLVDHFSCELWL